MNVTENQVDDVVGLVIENLQLPPDLSNDLYKNLVIWLDNNDVDIIVEK